MSPLVNEEALHAFVDGETDAQTNALVLAFLASSPADAARVDAWRSQNELIRTSFSKIEQDPVPLALSLTPPHVRTDKPARLAPAATMLDGSEEPSPPNLKNGDLAKLCAAIGIAFAAGMMAALVSPRVATPLAELFPNQPATVAKLAPESHLPSETLEIAAIRDQLSLVEAQSHAQNQPPAKPARDANPAPALFRDLAALELTVSGFQIGTPARHDPALCLFLATDAGEPLTLCLEKTGLFEAFAFHTKEALPLRAVDWPEKTSRFALAGRLPETALLDLAQRIHAKIGATPLEP